MYMSAWRAHTATLDVWSHTSKCIYTHLYIYIFQYIFIYMHVFICKHIGLSEERDCIYMCTHISICVYIYSYVCIHIGLPKEHIPQLHIYVHALTYTHFHIPTYILCIHIHTYIHIYTYRSAWSTDTITVDAYQHQSGSVCIDSK